MAVVAVAVGMVGCGPAAEPPFNGNFLGVLSETDTCPGQAADTYDISWIWVVQQDPKTLKLDVATDRPCAHFTGTASDATTAALDPFTCRTQVAQNGSSYTERFDTGRLLLDASGDMNISLTGSYTYVFPGGNPVTCGSTVIGSMTRFE